MGPSQTHFSPPIAARAKMSLSRAQNIFMPVNINSIVIVVTIGPVFILSDVSLAVAVVIAKIENLSSNDGNDNENVT